MLFLSDSKGTGGGIKENPDDFVVQEITQRGRILERDTRYTAADLDEKESPEGKFTTFVLQKRQWNTVQALVSLAKATGHGKKSVGYAGTKDRNAVTVQLASIYGITPDQLALVTLKDISINGAWRSDGVNMGSNIGNAFRISVSDPASPERAEETIAQLDGKMPNYFDRQRFGSRLNNAKIGLEIMRSNFEDAAMLFLTDPSWERNKDAVSARKRLSDEREFGEALSYFPRYLKNERYLLQHLERDGNDYAGAIRRLPRGISLMFIHAVQSLIFNLEVEDRVREQDLESGLWCRSNFYGFPEADSPVSEKADFPISPLIGYETKDAQISDRAREALDSLNITKESFKIKGMPELSMRGAFRPIVAPVKSLSANAEGDRLLLSFSIPSGSYATVLINEITKSDEMDLKDLA
jgi:tRNA pseudouridine13 synthase